MTKSIGEKTKSYINYASIILVILSLIFVLVTHIKINLADINDKAAAVPKELLIFDIILILLISFLIAIKIRNFIKKHLKDAKQSKLQRKVIQIIVLFAALPPLLCVTYFYIYFSQSSKMWFNNAIDRSLQESLEISKIYVEENKTLIKDNLFQLKRFSERNTDLLLSNPLKFEKKFSALAASRSITEAVIMIQNKNKNKILSKTSFSFYPSVEDFNLYEDYKPDELGVSIIIDDDDNYMRAITKLDNMPNTYILLGVLINDKVIRHIKNVQGANKEYTLLKANIENTQEQFLISFSILSFLLLLTLVLLFMIFISKYILPLVEVISATQKISDGNYNFSLDEQGQNAEISVLYSSFNKMVKLIAKKNSDLSYSKKLSETKNDFLEFILGSMPSAVVYLNTDKNVTLYNVAASKALHRETLYGLNIIDVIPELDDLILTAEKQPDLIHEKKLKAYINDETIELQLLLSIDFTKGEIRGFIINFLPLNTK
ncbi:MAG: hypothetical protein ISQ32_03975 [Rickettsiales bacterium]|nr:hypothetical protein [Rickettsiales bacterium]